MIPVVSLETIGDGLSGEKVVEAEIRGDSLRVKRRLEENEGRIGSFYGLLYVEQKRTGGKKKVLKSNPQV